MWLAAKSALHHQKMPVDGGPWIYSPSYHWLLKDESEFGLPPLSMPQVRAVAVPINGLKHPIVGDQVSFGGVRRDPLKPHEGLVGHSNFKLVHEFNSCVYMLHTVGQIIQRCWVLVPDVLCDLVNGATEVWGLDENTTKQLTILMPYDARRRDVLFLTDT